MIRDAIGNEVVLGKLYGYTGGSNSITTAVVAVAKGFSKAGKVRLEVLREARYLYGESAELHTTATWAMQYEFDRPTDRSVHSFILFPIDSASF